MSKAYREWKERREWGFLHRYPTPKKRMTMRNYKRWRKCKARRDRDIAKSVRDLRSNIMPHEWAEYIGISWNRRK